MQLVATKRSTGTLDNNSIPSRVHAPCLEASSLHTSLTWYFLDVLGIQSIPGSMLYRASRCYRPVAT